jgi:NAD(P)-dependent dehydrogenase (short-subunit alcohol dehydrogenase family)
VLNLTSKNALVAGASRGIGLAIARALAEAGARTILAARSIDKLEAQAKALREEGLSAAALQLDFTSSDSIQKAADTVGPVDILVNVAGTNIRKPFEQYTREDYDFILQTNLHGIFELTQKIGARMQAKGGKIINIGSLMSMVGLPYASIYAMSKGAIAQMTKALAAEWGKYNIQVNCIAPGFILTDLNKKMWEQAEMAAWLRGVQANPRLGSVDDIAPLAVFLAGKGADYITGQVIAVDGGYMSTAIWPFQP